MKLKFFTVLPCLFLSFLSAGQSFNSDSLLGKWIFYLEKSEYDTLIFQKIKEFPFSDIFQDKENWAWELNANGEILSRHFKPLFKKLTYNDSTKNRLDTNYTSITKKAKSTDSIAYIGIGEFGFFWDNKELDNPKQKPKKLPKLSREEKERIKKKHDWSPFEVVFTAGQMKRRSKSKNLKNKKIPLLYGENIIEPKSEMMSFSFWNQGKWRIENSNYLIIKDLISHKIEKYFIIDCKESKLVLKKVGN